MGLSTKRKWTAEEDETLARVVKQEGRDNWTNVAEHLPGRLPKQCRERWLYRINPSIVNQEWTIEEDVLLVKLYHKIGSKWTKMTKHFIGRNDVQIKNRYHQNLKKRIEQGLFEIYLRMAADHHQD